MFNIYLKKNEFNIKKIVHTARSCRQALDIGNWDNSIPLNGKFGKLVW